MAKGQSPEKSLKFYLAHNIAQLPIGTRFFNNPPHITQTPPAFIAPEKMPEIEEFLQSLAAETDAIALKSMGMMFVGHRAAPTHATRFEKPPALDFLHRRLISGLGSLGCEFMSLDYALGNYKPHSEAILLDEDEVINMGNMTVHTKRPHPYISGLTEITHRYDLHVPAI